MGDTIQKAQDRWYGILSHFGLDERYLRNRHSDCPLCGDGRDRYRWDDKNGTGSFICGVCGAGSGMDLLMKWKGWDFKQAAAEVDKIIGNIQPKKQAPQKAPTDRLRKIAKSLQTAQGSINPVRLYLRSRGITTLPGEALKLSPAQPYYEDGKVVGTFPAMVALVQGHDGKPLTYHVTYLTKEGRKAPVSAEKKLVSSVEPGAAIRLGPVARHIGVAEGIESALAAKEIHGMVCWATVNSTLMEQFKPPHGVKFVSICADNDGNFTGQKSAYILANRLSRDGYKCRVLIPNKAGQDWADVWAECEQEALA